MALKRKAAASRHTQHVGSIEAEHRAIGRFSETFGSSADLFQHTVPPLQKLTASQEGLAGNTERLQVLHIAAVAAEAAGASSKERTFETELTASQAPAGNTRDKRAIFTKQVSLRKLKTGDV